MTSVTNCVLDYLNQPVELTVGQSCENWDLSEIDLHLCLFALLLILNETLIVFIFKVEEVAVLHGPHGRVRSTFTDISQVVELLVLATETELTEIVALVEFGKYDLLRLEAFIETDR